MLVVSALAFISNAQTSVKDKDAASARVTKATARPDTSAFEKEFASKAVYPLIKGSTWSGVIPVNNIDEKPDVNMRYKLLMEITTGFKDSAAGKINDAIAEIGRLINIHVQAGIPKQNIDLIIVAHGPILRSFYNNEVYRKKYKVDNPNIAVYNELLNAGAKFIACGQAMSFFHVDKEEMLPWMKVALSAQTVMTNYQIKGYILKKVVIE